MNYSLFFIGLVIGTYMPDIDLHFKGILRHRSILTHTCLVPIILFTTFTGNATYVLAGLCYGMTIHLFCDLFPKSWKGFSTIKPFKKEGTIVTMLVSIMILILIEFFLLMNEENILFFILIGQIIFMHTSKKEKHLLPKLVGTLGFFLCIFSIIKMI